MQKMRVFLLIITLLSFSSFIYSHGFGCFSYAKSSDKGYFLAGQIKRNQQLFSYNGNTHEYMSSTVKTTGTSITNCYFTISFPQRKNDITCTPTQLFYLPEFDRWVPAFQLQIEDELLTAFGDHIPITGLEFVREQLFVYSFEIKDTHTLFVGSQSVLAHNMIIPGFFMGVSVSFGSGATSGGAMGSFFGPITLIGGVVIGGLIGIAAYNLGCDHSFNYELNYNPDAILNYLNENQNQGDSSGNYHNGSCGYFFPGNPNDNNDDDDFFNQLKSRATKKARTNKFGNMYKDPDTGLWWSIDKGRHGGSYFKVFKETARGFEHLHCADRFGNFIVGKHKGPIGIFISLKDVIFRP